MLSPQKLPLSSPLSEKFASMNTRSPAAKSGVHQMFNFGSRASLFRYEEIDEAGMIDFNSKKMTTSRKSSERIISFKVKDGAAGKVYFQYISAYFDGQEVPEEWICNTILKMPVKKNSVNNAILDMEEEDKENESNVVTPHSKSAAMDCPTDDLMAHKNKRKYQFADLSKLQYISLEEINAFVPFFFETSLIEVVEAAVSAHNYSLNSKLEAAATEAQNMQGGENLVAASATIKPILISIEGNIGAGKSYLLRKLRAAHPEWKFIDEPVDFWESLRNDANESLLEVFYKDKRRWSYTFQNCALLSRFNNIETTVAETSKLYPVSAKPTPVVFITERCLDTDHQVFAKMLHADGELDNLEFDLYQRWFALLGKSATKLSAIVYVDTLPDMCSDRINIRNRNGEDGIPIEYLSSLDKFQRTWIDSTHVPTVRTLSDEVEKVEAFVANLLKLAE